MSQKPIRNTILTVLVCVFAMAVCANGKTVYVDDDAAGANDGSSWADAYNCLQDALMFATAGDEIRVAQGTYNPDDFVLSKRPNLGREESFQLINGVTLKGGYAGFGQPDPSTRNIELYETIFSGDIGTLGDYDDNSYHVVTSGGTDATAVLSGFTITAGRTNGLCYDPNGCGGGMYNNSGSPTIANCMFVKNLGCFGAGMSNWNNSNPTLTNCTFVRNNGGFGAAIHNYYSSPTLTDCTIINNEADEYGGAMYNQYSNPIITNCIFSRNSTTGYHGGAVLNDQSNSLFTNCTFAKNSANRNGGGLYDANQSCSIIRNCILWDDIPNEIDGNLLVVSHSNIQYGWPGEGNTSEPPLFADPNINDCHLKSQAGRWNPNSQSWVIDEVTSPCIDAGDPMSPIGLEPFPNGGIVNMGAYGGTAEASKSYFGKPPCETIVAGDINGDCAVDFKDFVLMALHWLEGR